MNTGTGLLVLIDFEKAFHTIGWDFLFEALKATRFDLRFFHGLNFFTLVLHSALLIMTICLIILNYLEESDRVANIALLFISVAEILSIITS